MQADNQLSTFSKKWIVRQRYKQAFIIIIIMCTTGRIQLSPWQQPEVGEAERAAGGTELTGSRNIHNGRSLSF